MTQPVPFRRLADFRDRLRPRLYGTNELTLLARSRDPDAMPRVRFIYAQRLPLVELHHGVDILNDDGTRTPVTVAEADTWDERFWTLLQAAAANVHTRSEVVGHGACVVSDPDQAAAIMFDVGHTPGPESHSSPLIHPDTGVLKKTGELVIAALSRHCFVLTGCQEEAGIERIIELAVEQAEAGVDLISVHPVIWRAAQWLPYDWAGDYPHLADRIHDAIRRYDRSAGVSR